ncbi:alpha/beta hydrolase [Flavobacterium sp. NRK F10]|uniref:alpha/beta hydrolase n=1 Tax=Flavobacterium sp. NRK F10 TaxID=2954931 RepID=UPI002090346E|nr:alpha/beta hydrolase [Flavobacterium sp. NRK F10]MCO6173981.1 alpha/beta hydrolase [Flavobacterium sp. NRK F10]
MAKIPVYFMPGLAASPAIFENIKLPEEQFEMFFLEWMVPLPEETLEQYAKRMSENVKHDKAVLIGVSFGGILVQEMKRFLNVSKVIIISSVKTNKELPKKMQFAKKTLAYKLIPTGLLANTDSLVKYSFGNSIVAKRIKLYEKYLSVRDKYYLDWSIQNVVNWSRTEPDDEVVHIHGDKDEVFPIQYISDCIVVKGGTHIMIINKFMWLNQNLPSVILEEKTRKQVV